MTPLPGIVIVSRTSARQSAANLARAWARRTADQPHLRVAA